MNEIDAVARRSYGKLIAYLAARTRDVAEAEDALSESLRGKASGPGRAMAFPPIPRPGSSPSLGAE